MICQHGVGRGAAAGFSVGYILAWVLLARATLRLGARVRLPGFDVVVLGPATSSASDLAACLLVLRPVVVLACLVAVAYGVASAALEQLVRVLPAARVAREGHLGDLFFLGATSSHFGPSSQGGDGLFPRSRVRSRYRIRPPHSLHVSAKRTRSGRLPADGLPAGGSGRRAICSGCEGTLLVFAVRPRPGLCAGRGQPPHQLLAARGCWSVLRVRALVGRPSDHQRFLYIHNGCTIHSICIAAASYM